MTATTHSSSERHATDVHSARHDEIVAAAATLFHRHGYPGTSIQLIADHVGILKGSLYHHIRSKADLLHRVIQDLHDNFIASMRTDLEHPDGSPADRVFRLLDRHLDILLDNMDAASVYRTSMEHLETETRGRLMRERGTYQQHVADLLAEAQATGSIRDDIDPELLTSLCFAAVNAPSLWKPGKLLYPVNDVRYAVRELLRNGIEPTTSAVER